MHNTFIKEWLINKRARVYSVIADKYNKELTELKPTLFRSWLAREIDIPEEKINLNSLYSALTRLRKKEAMQKEEKSKKNINYRKENEAFNFSSPNTDDKKETRIKEM